MEPNIIRCYRFYEFAYYYKYCGEKLCSIQKDGCYRFNIANAVTCYTCQHPLYCSEECRIEDEQNTYEKIHSRVAAFSEGELETIYFQVGHSNDECRKAFHLKRFPSFKMELFGIFNEHNLINTLYEYHTQWLAARVMRALDNRHVPVD